MAHKQFINWKTSRNISIDTDDKHYYKKIADGVEWVAERDNQEFLRGKRFSDQPQVLNYILLKEKYQTIMDIGFGVGNNIQLPLQFPWIKYIGVDFSIVAIKKSKKIYNLKNTVQGDAFKLPVKDGSIDIVIFSYILKLYEKFERRVELLKEIERILRKEGRLILVCRNDFFLHRLFYSLNEGLLDKIGRMFKIERFILNDFYLYRFNKKDINLML